MPHTAIYRSLFLLMIIIVIAAACAPPAPTISPQRFQVTPLMLTLVFEGSCDDDPDILEAWIGAVSAARQNVIRIVDDSLAKDSAYVALEIEALVNMRNGLSLISAPDCAAQAHSLMASIVDRALELVQMYANKDLGTDSFQYDQIQEAIEQFDLIMDRLTNQLAELTEQAN